VIGLFDSGLGGLTVLRRLRERLPQADLVYFADQAHVPYGDKNVNELRELLRTNVAWLNDYGCELIAMACNTSCSIANDYGWPISRARIFDLIDAAACAVEAAGCRRVAVLATTATVRSGAYARAIRARIANARVTEIAAPRLVPLVESGAGATEVEAAVSALCASVPREIDALVYGCTHYPLLDATFARYVGTGVARIDPAIEQASRVALAAERAGISVESGATHYVTTGDRETFDASIAALAG